MCGLSQRRWGITQSQREAITRWAERNTCISEVRVFGSRAKGCARIDSDLDIAITTSDTNYHFFSQGWQDELAEITGLHARVVQYRLTLDDTVKQYCDEFSIKQFPNERLA
jgi:predicted nucleotidyltransferase